MILGIGFITLLIITTSITIKHQKTMKKQLTDEEKEIILELISNSAICDPEHIDENTRLEQDLTLDSMDVVELIMRVEKEFNINIADSDIEQIKTVNCIYRLVAEQLN